MPASDGLARRKSSLRVPPLSEKVLITVIVMLFLLLHGLAGMALQRAGAIDRAPTGSDTTLQLYD